MTEGGGEERGSDRQGGKTEFAEADGISRTFRRRYDNRVGYLLHHLTVHPEHQKRRAGGENPIGKFLSVTGPRNGVAGAAAATSISRGSDCDDGGSGGARCGRRAYKLHTITLSRNTTAHVCPAKIALRPFQLIYLMPRFGPSRERGRETRSGR